MALKMILETLDDVPEALHEFYTEKDGKYVLDAEGVDDHPAVASLKNAYRSEQERRRKLTTELAAEKAKTADLPEDFDPDEWARLKAEEEARQADPDNKDVRKQIETAVSAARQQEQTKAASQIKKIEGERDAAIAAGDATKAQLRKRIVEDDLNKALTEAGVTKPTFLKAAKAMLERDVEVIEEDDGIVARMKADLGGDEIAKYVATWVQTDDGKVFVEPAKGGDAPGGKPPGGNNGPNPWKTETSNLTQQMEIIRRDPTQAKRLMKAAGWSESRIAAQFGP